MTFNWKQIFKNKYVIALILFLLIVLFFDDNNLLERFSLENKKSDLETQIEFYEKEIKESNRKYDELSKDSKHIEKFAREEYFMKKDHEDVYIIVEKDN